MNSRKTERFKYQIFITKSKLKLGDGSLNRFQKEVNGSSYVCIGQAVASDGSIRPRTEAGVGDFYLVEQIANEYDAQHDGSPIVMVQLRDGTTQRYGLLKIAAPIDHDETTNDWLDYVAQKTRELVDTMQQQNPNADLVGILTLCNCADKRILSGLREYVVMEELIGHRYKEVKKCDLVQT